MNFCFKSSMPNVFFFIIIIIFPAFLNPGLNPAMAEGEKKYQTYELGEVIVTGERETKESPTTISEVSGAEIEKYNASNLGEALKLLPGVYLRQGRVKQESYATVRGFEQDKVLILLDGMPIYQPYEGLVNLTDIPAQNIAKIKVIKGVSSSLYGPNTMGGVINVITKKGGRDPEASLSCQVSDYNTRHIEATHGWKIGSLSYFMGASHKESDGFKLAENFTLPSDILAGMAQAPTPIPHTPIKTDSGLRDNSDYERDAITFTGTWDSTPNNTLGLSLEYYNNEYGIPAAAIYRETRSAGGTAHWYPRYWRFDDWERYTINVTEEYKVSKSIKLKGRFFYDDYQSVLNAYDDNTYTSQFRTAGAPSFDSKYDDYNTGFNLYGFWDGIENHHIRIGYSFKRDVHESEYTFYLSPSEYEKLISHTCSAALEDSMDISEKLTFTIGASYDTFEQKDRRQSFNSAKGDDINSFNPHAGISYDVSDSLNLYASAGKKIRFPTMKNLYANGVIGPQGNPDLKEEKTFSYEFGGQWRINHQVTFEGALFYNDIKNLILFDNQIGRFEQYENAKIYGAELSLLAKFTANLTGRLSYTFLVAENDDSTVIIETEHLKNDLIYKPDEIPYRPKHKIDMDLTKSFDFGVKLHLNGSWISDQTYYNHADSADNSKFVAEKNSLDGFFLLNTKITYDFNKHYQVFGAVENLLNEDYQELYLSPAPGISAWVGVKIAL
ncbi:TonB-dependent receptor [Desulfobacula phenolica]|uniref:Outer membrane receptor for ferrienterochelin and colicins n=1 Tax=Desulfobacula phenolica TaxID=90732 RepID=A0A1H2J3E4_9BACT|nr:TonB-dependent receptor [Desulfobacula phenolica]SDU50832.1 outer membrane receptor for ferrienterochelin and colicins [Desulfobacula phenolica]